MDEEFDRQLGFDRRLGDVGNLVEFGHVNVAVPDQRAATLFYVMGLGLTRDPYLNAGVDNMWVNAGAAQFHLPTGGPQVLRGTVGLVVPDLAALTARLDRVLPRLDGHAGYRSVDGAVEVACPWGNRIRVHAPDPARFGPMRLGMPYLELDAPPGSAGGIARFYAEVIGTPATLDGASCRVPAGTTTLIYRETGGMRADDQGEHIQVTLADFSGPHGRLSARGLVSAEDDAQQYRFRDIVDPATGALLATVEHEVRSMRHPMYGRVLVNRDPEVTPQTYRPGPEAFSSGWAGRA